MTSMGVGSFIFYHPRLTHLEYEQSVGALAHLQTLGNDVELEIWALALVGKSKLPKINTKEDKLSCVSAPKLSFSE